MPDSHPVSVVIPHYESPASLGRTLRSILNQTVLPAEVILVDDASSTPARRAAQQLISAISVIACRFEVLEVNSGPGAARNAGWDLARQPIVAFIDADDSWSPRKIELQAPLLLGLEDLDAVGHPMLVSAEVGELAEPEPALSETAGRCAPGQSAVDFTVLHKKQWLRRNRFATSGVMLRRELPFRFRTDERYAEDYDLWLRIAFSGLRMAVMGEPLGRHYKAVFGDSGMSSKLWAMERGELRAVRSLQEAGLISNVTLGATVTHSLSKYLLRVLRVNARKIPSSPNRAV